MLFRLGIDEELRKRFLLMSFAAGCKGVTVQQQKITLAAQNYMLTKLIYSVKRAAGGVSCDLGLSLTLLEAPGRVPRPGAWHDGNIRSSQLVGMGQILFGP